ncbi:enhanced entry protein EnhC [Legionella israelensis]|nr:enhanced entry protein EnhC [Legionella israelensis]
MVSRFVVGTYLSEGKGIAKNEEKGQQLLRQAASESFSYADLNLAVLAEQSHKEFLPALIKAYQLGNSKAGLLLADYTLASEDSFESLQRARTIYSGLAEKGDQFAQLKLAYMYDKGIGASENPQLAQQWYLASAEQGNTLAQYQLGQLYQSGRLSQPDYAKALAWYEKASQKSPEAFVAMGFIYETVEDQYVKAIQAYQKAAEEGNALGAYNLGLMYEYGKGTEVNNLQAKKYYQEAADKEMPSAMTQLAGLYFNGAGTQRDAQKALAWYKKAAALGDDKALYQLGLLSETGLATRLSYSDAIHYYQQAAEKGNEKAMIALQGCINMVWVLKKIFLKPAMV